MATQRQVIPIRFDQGVDVGGEDPRIKVGGLLKAENLYPERGGLVQRDGLTSVGRGVRALGDSVLIDPRGTSRVMSNTLQATWSTNERVFCPTVWERVAEYNPSNTIPSYAPGATGNTWAQITPLVYSANGGGANLYAVLDTRFSTTYDSTFLVFNADRGEVVASTTMNTNGRTTSLCYDSETGNVYASYSNLTTSNLAIKTVNLLASTITFSALTNVTGLTHPVNTNVSFQVEGTHGHTGILRYEKNQSTDPGVYIKRLCVAYYSTNGTNHGRCCWAAINTEAMTIGADTNETAQLNSVIATNLAATTILLNDADCIDAGPRMSNSSWRFSGSYKTAIASYLWRPINDTTIQHVYITSAGPAFGNSIAAPAAGTHTPIAVVTSEANCTVSANSETESAAISQRPHGARVGVYNAKYRSDPVAHGTSLVARPFLVGDLENGVTMYPVTFVGGNWFDSTNATAVVKATPQRYTALFARAQDRINANSRPMLSARVLVGNTWKGSNTNNLPTQIRVNEIQRISGYSYGNSSTTNAYYFSTWRNEGADGRALVLYRMATDSVSDGMFSDATQATVAGGTVISGGAPVSVSNGIVNPVGFYDYPDSIYCNIVDNTSGNSYSSLGSVGFCATYEYVDGRTGKLVRSAPSAPVSLALTHVQNKVNVTVVAPGPSYKLHTSSSNSSQIDDRIVIYRTDPNGTQYFECARSNATLSTNGYYTATVLAENLTTNTANGVSVYPRALYTQTEVENIYPYGHMCGTSYLDRYVYVDYENRATDIYYSKPLQPGVAVEFNEFLQIKAPSSGGDITALCQMDDRLIIFKSSEIYSTYGEGFGPNLGGQNFAPPRRIASGVGCSTRNCVSQTPNGLVFLSASGMWLLGRDEQLSRIGSQVSYYTSTYTYTCSATNMQKRYVAFVSGDASAPALIYSFDSGTWSTFTGLYAGARFITVDPSGNDVLGGGIRSTQVNTVNPGDNYNTIYITNTNSTETMNVAVETGWYSFSGQLGFERWKKTILFMEKSTNHNVTVNTAYDGDPLWIDSQDFNASVITSYDYTAHYGAMTNTSLADQTYKLEFSGSRQKTDMIRHGIYINSIVGGSVGFLGMGFEVINKPGLVRLGPDKKVR